MKALFYLFILSSVDAIEFPWSSKPCAPGYDFCGDLEFCASSGFHLPGETSCSLQTAPAIRSSDLESCDSFGFRLPGETSCSLQTAPVIRMAPGKKYLLTLKNTAPAGDEYDTNICMHGLHISGDGNGNDVTRTVASGLCMSYSYDIPYDHMGGTYWYHSSKHHNTDAHVKGGAFGMLIIEEQSNLAPTPGIAQWLSPDNEVLLIASKIGQDVRGNGNPDTELIPVIADEWYRLRVAAVEPKAASYDIEVDNCEVRAVAHDGVWRREVPSTTVASSYKLTGASRMDFAVKCSTGSHQVSYAGKVIAELQSSVGTTTIATPFDNGATWQPFSHEPTAWQPFSHYYLEDLRNTAADDFHNIDVGSNFINGESWDEATPIATCDYDTVQEWTISASDANPFHLHLYHMQIVEPGGCGVHEEGEYYDTISYDGSCTVRFRMTDVGGRCVMHSNNLANKDNGAMAWVDVQEGPPPAVFNPDVAAGSCPGLV